MLGYPLKQATNISFHILTNPYFYFMYVIQVDVNIRLFLSTRLWRFEGHSGGKAPCRFNFHRVVSFRLRPTYPEFEAPISRSPNEVWKSWYGRQRIERGTFTL